jgi:hypothetical protein
MNISLTIFFVLAVLLAMTLAVLALVAAEGGEIFPWQLVASFMIGLCLTHGQYFESAYAWVHSRLRGDGDAGMVLSAMVGCLVELGMASLPMLGGLAIYGAMAGWEKNRPSLLGIKQTRRDKIIAFLRSFGIR